MWIWRIWITFYLSLCMIWGIQAKFPLIAPILEYLRNRYSSTHRGPWHYSKVSFDMKQGAEDFGLLFMCHCTWFGVFRPNLPKLLQYPSICETGIAQPTEGHDTRVRSQLMWNKELHMIWGIQVQFPQIVPMPEYLWNRYNLTYRGPRH